VAFAAREDLKGRFIETSRHGFHLALDVSAYSLVAVARAAEALLAARRGSLVTMTYYGAEKVFPHYNVMGIAKAALEASMRYLAADLGPAGIRVNAISAGPLRTLSAAASTAFARCSTTTRRVHRCAATSPPTKWPPPPSTCAAMPRAAVTGEVLHVDGGYNITGM
jgi:enoyl-[acyl-carrier protein] reductase I